MRYFKPDQRVLVKQAENGVELNMPGTVARIRGDDGAYVALDTRSSEESVHPFDPHDPERRTWTVAFPEDCEAL